MSEFIFMLTHDDATVPNALAVYGQSRGSGLRYVGFKDVGARPEELAAVVSAAHSDGLEAMLEVVSTSEEDEIRSIQAARDIGVDWVLGGTHAAVGAEILAGSNIKYCPFPGRVEGHPSILKGEIDEIARHARQLMTLPEVVGADLLAYRHVSVDPLQLIRAVATAVTGPLIVAGSINSVERIRDVAAAGAWGFTIGGAIFEGRLPGAPGIGAQLEAALAAAASGNTQTRPSNR